MGIIKRQSFKATIVSYIGVALGYLNIILILPKYLSTTQIGLIRVMTDAATLFAAFASLGMINASQRFFPRFADNHGKHKGFVLFTYLVPYAGVVTLGLCLFAFSDVFLQPFQKNAPELIHFAWLLPFFTFLTLSLSLLETHASNLFRIVVPKVLRDIYLRVVLSALVLLFAARCISFQGLVYAHVLAYFPAVIFLVVYIIKLSQGRLSGKTIWPSKSENKEILTYCSFILIGGIGSMVANKIDSFMLSSMLPNGLSKNGIYTTALFIATIIEIPGRSIISISIPVVTRALEDKDYDRVSSMYKNTSTFMFSTGFFLFLLVWLNAHDIFMIMPKGTEFETGKYVILFLGIARLLDAVTSLNMTILLYSAYYKVSLLLIVVLGGLTIALNYYLIPLYGITGAAIATAIAILLYQVIASTYLYLVFKMQPFSIGTIKTLVTGITCWILIVFIPDIRNPFVNIFIHSFTLILLFGGITILWKTMPELNQRLNSILSRFNTSKPHE